VYGIILSIIGPGIVHFHTRSDSGDTRQRVARLIGTGSSPNFAYHHRPSTTGWQETSTPTV